jgi:hypothetical protein
VEIGMPVSTCGTSFFFNELDSGVLLAITFPFDPGDRFCLEHALECVQENCALNFLS